jgi:hypothetical protein
MRRSLMAIELAVVTARVTMFGQAANIHRGKNLAHLKSLP